jgi:hypothetical protein
MTHNCALATTNNNSWPYEQIKNIKSYAGFDMMLLYPYRDSVHAYNNAPNDFIPIPCSFSNALYRTDDNKIGIVRVIGDYTVSQGPSGGRDCSWCIYDCYTKDLETNPRKMLLNDLSDDYMVFHYGDDRWANLEWKIFETDVDGGIVWDSRGLRRTLLTTKDLSVWLRANQPRLAFINPDVPVKNMYNEPVMAFAVKRVLDKPGTYPDYKFEDGTTFLPISLLKDVNDVFFDNSMSPVFIPTFDRYNTHNIFVNDVQDSSFGLCNTK